MTDALSMTVDPSDFLKGLDKFIKDKAPEAEAAAKKTGLWLMNAAVKDAPVATGLLRSSASILVNGAPWTAAPDVSKDGSPRHPSSEQAPKNKNETIVVVGFNTDYAAENDTDRNRAHPKGGKAGYLTDNFRKAKSIYERFLKAELK